jgi:hypothetical protein
MSTGNPLCVRQRAFGIAIEAAVGTAATTVVADTAFMVYDPEIKFDIPMVKRPSPSSMSQRKGVPGARAANVKARTELAGSNLTGSMPQWTRFLQAAGFANTSGTWSPVSGSGSADSATCAMWKDGRLRRAIGVMFKAVIHLKTGEPGFIDWDGMGLYEAPSTQSLVVQNVPSVIPPRFAGATVTVGGAAYLFDELTIEINNTLYLRPDPSHTSNSGYRGSCISDREILVKLNPEAATTKDFNADHIAGAEAALSLILNGGANNTITVSAPKMQHQEPPNEGEREGVVTDELAFQCNLTANAGDDEFTIQFT